MSRTAAIVKFFPKRFKKQTANKAMKDIKLNFDGETRTAPLNHTSEANAKHEKTPPGSPWPLSALFGRPRRFRAERKPLSPLNLGRFDKEIGKGKDDLMTEISENLEERDNVDFARSPLHKFKLCRPTYFSSHNAIHRSLTEVELTDRREFVVVVAASLQKFGAASHLTEAFTDSVAKVSILRKSRNCRRFVLLR